MKRRYKRNELKLRATQGCLTESVAYYFNIHPMNVPFFIYPRKTWMKKLRNFFKIRGFKIVWQQPVCLKNDNKLRIVVGNSRKWKTSGHCVVYRGLKKVYDPDWTGTAMKGRPTHELVVKKD